MDTALNLQSATPTVIAAAPAVERAVTTKVTKLEKSDGEATLPFDKVETGGSGDAVALAPSQPEWIDSARQTA